MAGPMGAGSICHTAKPQAFTSPSRDVLRAFEHKFLRCQPFAITRTRDEIRVVYFCAAVSLISAPYSLSLSARSLGLSPLDTMIL